MKRQGGLLIRNIAIGIIVALACAIVVGIVDARRSVALTMHYATAYKLRHGMQICLYKNNAFPPRVSCDSKSGPEASWRVLLELAERGRDGLDYNFEEDWSSVNNARFARKSSFIKYYSSLSKGALPVVVTTFVAIDDLPSILHDEQSVIPNEVRDGLENTLLVAQVPDSDIAWSEPRDVTFDEFARACGTDTASADDKLSVGYKNQLLLFGDGEIYRVASPIPLPTYKALWTRASGDGPDRKKLVREGCLDSVNDEHFHF